MTAPIIRAPGEGEELINPLGAKVLIRVTGEQTSGSYTIIEAEQPADGAPAPLHIHDFEDEAIQVLEGSLVMEIGGNELHAPAGTYVFVPRGVSQTFWNPGPELCRYQSIFSPAGQENYLREAYSLERTAPDYAAEMARIRAKYGLRYPAGSGEQT